MTTTHSTDRHATVSLAKRPIRLLGLAGIVFGVLALILGGNSFALRIPHGSVGDGRVFGLLTNGWTDLLFVAAGLLLVLGSSAHWTARATARLTALVLGAAAIVAVIRGNGVFGIFAANHWTEIVWGAAAIALAVMSKAPRIARRRSATPTAASTPASKPTHGVPAGDTSDPRTTDAAAARPLVSVRD